MPYYMSSVLAPRVALALWLIHSMDKTWVIEQPASSLAARHPRFRALLKCMRIWRIAFWLCKYGAASPKRLKLWSNSRGIRFFGTSALTKKQRERLPHRLAETKIGPDGRKTYTGNKALLKDSQTRPQRIYIVTRLAPAFHVPHILFMYVHYLRSYPPGFARKFARSLRALRSERSPARKLAKACMQISTPHPFDIWAP